MYILYIQKTLNRAYVASFTVATFFAMLFGGLVLDSALAAPQPKVTICHVDPDDDGAGHETLEVNVHSLAKHLAHGDGEGACLTCGNGLVEAGEQCDDGNTTPGDDCSATCTVETAICGDTFVTAPEQCDDGNTQAGDGCSDSCVIEFCGDGIKNNGLNEECDLADLNDMTCDDFVVDGFNLEGNLLGNVRGYLDGVGGELACFSNCQFNTNACLGTGRP